jgi:AraC family transcriptional regulator of adaptative response/methylated-DNA-[protein]-cysteine methyltransferase
MEMKTKQAAAPQDLVRRVCALIETHESGTPTLAHLGEKLGLSPFHLQRVFKSATGVTPRQWAEARRMEQLKGHLRSGASVTGALYEAGFNAPSRLYEGSNKKLGMTPASYAKGGRGAHIRFGAGKSSLGWVLLAATEEGLCKVSLGDKVKSMTRDLVQEFPEAHLERDEPAIAGLLEAVISLLETGKATGGDLPLDIRPTAFQARVWDMLRRIPAGETRTYGQIASQIGSPTAARAVAQACATNPVALVIPCHRVIGGDGKLRGYRWGLARKKALLAREQKA